LQANAKGRPVERLKSSGENVSKESMGKVNNVHIHSGDGYTPERWA
jgi:hypothetical protein